MLLELQKSRKTLANINFFISTFLCKEISDYLFVWKISITHGRRRPIQVKHFNCERTYAFNHRLDPVADEEDQGEGSDSPQVTSPQLAIPNCLCGNCPTVATLSKCCKDYSTAISVFEGKPT